MKAFIKLLCLGILVFTSSLAYSTTFLEAIPSTSNYICDEGQVLKIEPNGFGYDFICVWEDNYLNAPDGMHWENRDTPMSLIYPTSDRPEDQYMIIYEDSSLIVPAFESIGPYIIFNPYHEDGSITIDITRPIKITIKPTGD